jgi:hypothetical protein
MTEEDYRIVVLTPTELQGAVDTLVDALKLLATADVYVQACESESDATAVAYLVGGARSLVNYSVQRLRAGLIEPEQGNTE